MTFLFFQEKEMKEENERLREMLADEEEENSNGMLNKRRGMEFKH